jgi:hypothetical protein
MQAYELEAQRLDNEMIEKQKQFYQKSEQELDESLPKKFKDSCELIALRSSEQRLVKLKNYEEAERAKLQRIAQVIKIFQRISFIFLKKNNTPDSL